MFTIEEKCGKYHEQDYVRIIPDGFGFAILCSEISAVCINCGYDDTAGGELYTVIKSDGTMAAYCKTEDDDTDFRDLMDYIGLGDVWISEDNVIPNTLHEIVLIKLSNVDVTFSKLNGCSGTEP